MLFLPPQYSFSLPFSFKHAHFVSSNQYCVDLFSYYFMFFCVLSSRDWCRVVGISIRTQLACLVTHNSKFNQCALHVSTLCLLITLRASYIFLYPPAQATFTICSMLSLLYRTYCIKHGTDLGTDLNPLIQLIFNPGLSSHRGVQFKELGKYLEHGSHEIHYIL